MDSNDSSELLFRARGLTEAPIGRALLDKVRVELDLKSEFALHQAVVKVLNLADEYAEPHVPQPRRFGRMTGARDSPRSMPPNIDAAVALLKSAAAKDWFSTIDLEHQVWISRDGSPPGLHAMTRDWRYFSSYASKPRGGFWTSGRAGNVPSAWIANLLGGPDFDPVLPPFRLWRMSIAGRPRVYEIGGLRDWISLATAYPGRNGAYLAPNWEAVAQDFDAVHLSEGGMVVAQGLTVTTGGLSCRLQGWDSESTLWLHWQFDQAARLPDWIEVH